MQTYFTITAQQIKILQGTSYETARKEWHRLRQLCKLRPKEALRLKDVAACWGAPVGELASALYSVKAK